MSSFISPSASIESGVLMGAYCVIEKDVVIRSGCVIGHHVVIREGTVIENNVRIDDYASVGKKPMKAATSAVTAETALPCTTVGEGCIIGSHAVVYRGATIGDKTLLADMATVRENVLIGNKVIIGRGVTVENHCTIGDFCKIESNAYITAYSDIKERCFVAPCVVTSNDNFAGRTKKRFEHFKGITVQKGGRIGAGAVVLPGKTIGEDAFVAAGSVVTKDVEKQKIVLGNPARYACDVPKEQLLENQERV